MLLDDDDVADDVDDDDDFGQFAVANDGGVPGLFGVLWRGGEKTGGDDVVGDRTSVGLLLRTL